MGLFDFMKTAGEETINEPVEVSAERVDEMRRKGITESIAKLDIEGEKVAVNVKGDVATLTGSAPNQESLEKIVLCAGNQFGIATVDCQLTVDSPPPQETAATATAAPNFYTVQAGDTLGKIAAQHYGDASKYPLIFEANQPMLKDPDKIFPGQTLRIPPG